MAKGCLDIACRNAQPPVHSRPERRPLSEGQFESPRCAWDTRDVLNETAVRLPQLFVGSLKTYQEGNWPEDA